MTFGARGPLVATRVHGPYRFCPIPTRPGRPAGSDPAGRWGGEGPPAQDPGYQRDLARSDWPSATSLVGI